MINNHLIFNAVKLFNSIRMNVLNPYHKDQIFEQMRNVVPSNMFKEISVADSWVDTAYSN